MICYFLKITLAAVQKIEQDGGKEYRQRPIRTLLKVEDDDGLS